jgi:hypothetical protein
MKPDVCDLGGFAGGEKPWERGSVMSDEQPVTIDGNWLESSGVIGANDCTLDGFSITHSSALGCSGGIYCEGTSPRIRNCRIVENSAAPTSYGFPDFAFGA